METLKSKCNIYFVGIGGVSMSALAKYCKVLGFDVSGSDREYSERIKELENLGIKFYKGHKKQNLALANVIVLSDAIPCDNEEREFAENSSACVLTRAELLNMISENFGKKIGVAGCHGKTTVTCMLAHILKCANAQFTAHIGGDDLTFGNFYCSGSDYFLSEVCEFKKNINSFTADYAVCTNTGVDHMDCYENETELKNTYLAFAKRAHKAIVSKSDSFLALNKPNSAKTFYIGEGEGYTARNLKENNGKYSFDVYYDDKKLGRINLSVSGKYSVENALSAISCALEMGIPFKKVKMGIKNFKGVKRRFENIGKLNGCDVIADYAHHPTEITASLENARTVYNKGKIFVAFQPHTFSRTVYLKEDFIKSLEGVKELAVYKTYSARETQIPGGRAEDLCERLPNSRFFNDVNAMLDYFKGKVKKGDLLLILGAGDLYWLVKGVISRI